MSPKNPDAEPGRRLSSPEAVEAMGHVAELSRAGAPLAGGLRAAAAESPSRTVANALRLMATRVDQGVPLETILDDSQHQLPRHVRGLVAVSTRTGQLGLALEQLVDHHRTTRAIWLGLVGSVSYPLAVLGFSLIVLSCFPFFIVPQFKVMFEEFDLELPLMTQLLINASDGLLWASTAGSWLFVGCFLLLLLSVFLLATGWGGGALQRVLTTVPFVGPLWHWSGTAAATRLLATLVEHQVPLPEALRLTADGTRNAYVGETCGWLADGVAGGATLSELLADSTRLPSSLVPLVRHGEKTGELGPALHDASEMFTARIRMRAQLLRSVSPTLVFVAVCLLAGFAILAIFLPLVSLIQGLS